MPLADVEVGAQVEVLRFENEAEDLLHYLKGAGMAPGLKGTLAESSGDDVVLQANGDVRVGHAQRCRDGLGRADPSPPPRTALPEQLVLGKDRYGR